MYAIYILKNNKSKRFYTGCTNNLTRRIDEHNRGQTKFTRQKGVWNLIYKEEYKTSKEAKLRERQIKSYKGGNAFKKLIAGVVQWQDASFPRMRRGFDFPSPAHRSVHKTVGIV